MKDDSLYEKQMLLKVASGDRSAFQILYKQYLPGLYRNVFLFTHSRETTEEIVQDVFIKIWEVKETLVNVRSFENYLYRSAKNKLFDFIRHEQVKYKVHLQLKRSANSASETIHDDVVYKEYYRIVQEAINTLPPKRKLIFKLSAESGLSHDEIAAHLKVSKSFVKGQLYKSYETVRSYLAKHGEFTFSLLAIFFLS